MFYIFFTVLLFMSTNLVCGKDGSDTYILKTGIAGQKNLEEQHKSLAYESYDQLRQAGLRSGQTVWDVGCGSGVMTEYLSEVVGKTGRVYALDASMEQLEVARNNLSAGENITFIHDDILNPKSLTYEQADIVYARFLLMHLKKPEEALSFMYSLLKPGGVVVLQESVMSTTRACVDDKDLEEYVATLVKFGKYRGVDFDIGDKMAALCAKVGFQDVRTYSVQPHLNANQAQELFLGRSAEWRDELINSKLVTAECLDGWVQRVNKLFLNANRWFYFSLARQVHIIAKK